MAARVNSQHYAASSQQTMRPTAQIHPYVCRVKVVVLTAAVQWGTHDDLCTQVVVVACRPYNISGIF